ncbi:MAG TPA: hypothetical protein VFO16_22945 [Pseudonocardiaceae bacterium]|nr:hypothetical protein [Pseudonocardiaceae bacterium]
MTSIFGIDGGSPDVRAAEHLLAEIIAALGANMVLFGCTHLVRTSEPHIALSVELREADAAEIIPAALRIARPGSGKGCAAEAARAHYHRSSGRAVRFPGQQRLTGVLPVREVLAKSAIDGILVLAAPAPDPSTLVDTRGFLRPLWQDGQLILHTVPAANGTLAPFELENPTPCCADHA